jgi:hypothetical protein
VHLTELDEQRGLNSLGRPIFAVLPGEPFLKGKVTKTLVGVFRFELKIAAPPVHHVDQTTPYSDVRLLKPTQRGYCWTLGIRQQFHIPVVERTRLELVLYCLQSSCIPKLCYRPIRAKTEWEMPEGVLNIDNPHSNGSKIS